MGLALPACLAPRWMAGGWGGGRRSADLPGREAAGRGPVPCLGALSLVGRCHKMASWRLAPPCHSSPGQKPWWPSLPSLGRPLSHSTHMVLPVVGLSPQLFVVFFLPLSLFFFSPPNLSQRHSGELCSSLWAREEGAVQRRGAISAASSDGGVREMLSRQALAGENVLPPPPTAYTSPPAMGHSWSSSPACRPLWSGSSETQAQQGF